MSAALIHLDRTMCTEVQKMSTSLENFTATETALAAHVDGALALIESQKAEIAALQAQLAAAPDQATIDGLTAKLADLDTRLAAVLPAPAEPPADSAPAAPEQPQT